MLKEIVLNELSVREEQNLYVARQRMAQLIATLLAAAQMGAGRSLRTHMSIDAMLLAPNYSVSRWRNDPEVDREHRSFLRSRLSKSPLLSVEDSMSTLDRNQRSEFQFDGREAVGLGAALLLDALSVSMASEPCWDRSRISVTCLTIEEDGELTESLADLHHASRPEHVAEHADWLAGRGLPIDGGQDLWQRRVELFPSLSFCPSVERQLEKISAGNPLLHQIYRRLAELDHYFRTYGGSFDPSAIPMKISPESESTLGQYEAEHSFVCPDGVRRLFSWHGRLTPGAWRIYFLPPAESRGAIIGYIGKKLPGVLYRT